MTFVLQDVRYEIRFVIIVTSCRLVNAIVYFFYCLLIFLIMARILLLDVYFLIIHSSIYILTYSFMGPSIGLSILKMRHEAMWDWRNNHIGACVVGKLRLLT